MTTPCIQQVALATNAPGRNDTTPASSRRYLLSGFPVSQELALKVMEIELPPAVMVHLLDEMSNTEERLAHGGSERLQLGSLVGAFATAR